MTQLEHATPVAGVAPLLGPSPIGAGSHLDPERYQREVRAEQLKLFCQQAIRIPVGVAFLAGYILYLFWNHVSHDLLIAWVAIVCGALLVRTYLSRRLLTRALSSEEVDTWIRRMTIFALLNGVFGGSAGIFFFPYAPLTEQALLTMMMAAWSAAAIATSGMLPRTFPCFSIPLLLPIIIGWWRSEEHWFTSLLLVAFLVYLTLYVLDAGRIFLAALRTRFENDALVHELRAKQGEAEAAREKAEAADRAKTHFLAAASHDLRQPLTALALFNRLLNDTAQDQETRRIAGHIDASVGSLERLMDALLNISKLDAGTVQPLAQLVSLDEMFARLEAQYAPLAAQKGLAFQARAAGNWVRTDAMLFERVVRNLIENALRYTHQGAIRVTARSAGEQVVVEVTDTGIGIAPSEQAKIFEEFYQVRNTERDAKQGLGLGLAIVQRTARLLGCELEVVSRPGVGSNFRVRVTRADPPPAQSEAGVGAREFESPDLTGLKILVVDDDATILTAMRGLLERWGCEVRTAETIDDADAQLVAMGERPDLLLVDFRLRNDETGLEVVRLANERFGRVPAVLITGETAPDRLRAVVESGLTLIHKPVRPEQLREQIERALELRPA